jgi:modification methylase
MTAAPALSVWPVAQTPSHVQRQGRYVPESKAHPGKMYPTLARLAIERYSNAGDLVVDPMCGIGTTLVEASHLDRRAIGIELEPRWAALAARNVIHARTQGAPGNALVLRGDAHRLGRELLADVTEQANLILTSPPYGPSTHGRVRLTQQGVQQYCVTYSDNPENLGQLPAGTNRRASSRLAAAISSMLVGCRRLIAPQGRLVITARPYRRDGALIDIPGQLVTLAQAAGFDLEARHAALL